jgi:hypothetical protein
MTRLPSLVLAVVLLAACGTHTLRVEPIKVEPIHLTVDVNLHETTTTGPSTPASGGPRR